MNNNPFRDEVNPYESPAIIQAEFADRLEPPRSRKPWPPALSIFYLTCGPVLAHTLMRYAVHDWHLLPYDGIMLVGYTIAVLLLWLVALVVVLKWLFSGS